MCLSITRMYFLTVSWSSGCSVSTRGREAVVSVRCRVSMYHLVKDGILLGIIDVSDLEAGVCSICMLQRVIVWSVILAFQQRTDRHLGSYMNLKQEQDVRSTSIRIPDVKLSLKRADDDLSQGSKKIL
jgi:hypothetical protein